jgi:hypothetical protein
MSASFMRVAEELQLTYNNTALERPRNLNKLYYTFNDNTNGMISYPLETIEDILEHYLTSFINEDTKNGVTLKKLNNDKCFGIGLNLEESINLAQNSVGLNIQSEILSTDPYYIYIYFLGVATI